MLHRLCKTIRYTVACKTICYTVACKIIRYTVERACVGLCIRCNTLEIRAITNNFKVYQTHAL